MEKIYLSEILHNFKFLLSRISSTLSLAPIDPILFMLLTYTTPGLPVALWTPADRQTDSYNRQFALKADKFSLNATRLIRTSRQYGHFLWPPDFWYLRSLTVPFFCPHTVHMASGQTLDAAWPIRIPVIQHVIVII